MQLHACESMQQHGLTHFDVIVTSPFRRCLQTAGLMAKAFSDGGGRSIAKVVVDNRLGEWLLAARRNWASAGIDPPGDYTYVSAADAAHWAGIPLPDLLWDREANQVLIESEDELAHRVQAMPSICESAIARARELTSSAESRGAPCELREQLPPRVLVVTHGDLINRFTPGFAFDTSIGRYCASECGWLACSGFAPLPSYDGDTIELLSVPRVLAVEGVERM